MKISEDALLEVVAETLDVPKDKLSWESNRESLREWDSLGHIMLMLAVEQRFSFKFSVEQIQNIRGLEDIRACMLKQQ